MHEPNIVILAGGISSRMKRSAQSGTGIDESLVRDAAGKSKSMIGVGLEHRPFLDYLLYNVHESGYRDVVLVIGEGDSEIRKYYDERRPALFSNLSIRFVTQPVPEGRTKPLGTADAFSLALESSPQWKGQHCTVCNSDNLYTTDTLKLLLNSNDENSLIAYDIQGLEFPRERVRQLAVLKTDNEGYLKSILEKPTEEELEREGNNPGISMNIFRFTYDDILPYLRSVPMHPTRKEKELPEAVRIMVEDHPRSVKACQRSEYVPDLTTVGDIPRVQQYIQDHFSDVRFQ